MLKVAIRNLRERKLRTILTSLAVVLGVMMVSGTYILTDTMEGSFDEIFTEAYQGVDATVTAQRVINTSEEVLPAIDASILDIVRDTDGVAFAEGAIGDPAVAIIGSDGAPIGGNGPPTLAFSTTENEQFDPLEYPVGGPPQTDDEVVLDKATADHQGFEIGDEITLAGTGSSGTYTLVGVGRLGDSDSFGGATMALLTLPEAQRLTGKEGQYDEISIAAEPGFTPEEVVANLEVNLPDTVVARTGAEAVESQMDDVGEFIGIMRTALLVFAGISLFVAAFLIFNTFSITVAQRTREFAMLRTMGASRRQILGSVSLEALVIGFGASVVGLLAGLVLAPGITALLASSGVDLPSTNTVIAARTIILSLVLGTTLTLAAALVPALRATRIAPVEGLREGAILATPKQNRIRMAIGALLALGGGALIATALFGDVGSEMLILGGGAAALFIGVAALSPELVRPLASIPGRPLARTRGISGKIAYQNSMRNPTRTAATAAALMIGLTLVTFVAVFAAGISSSIDKAIDDGLTAEIMVTNSNQMANLPDSFIDDVGEIEGVAVASPLRQITTRVEGVGETYASLFEPATLNDTWAIKWEEGNEETTRNMAADEVALGTSFAKNNNFAVGDDVVLTASSGDQLTLTVIGLYEDSVGLIGSALLSDANAEAFGLASAFRIAFVKLDDGADLNAVQRQISDMAMEKYPNAGVQNREELKDDIAAQLNGLLGVVYALLALSVIVSLVGIVNTLALAIHERTRELGLIRAVGSSRRQVRRIVRYESVITTLIGAIIGIVLGFGLAVLVSRPLAEDGFVLSVPWITLIVLLVLAIVAGILAAIGPARRASKTDILEALSYE